MTELELAVEALKLCVGRRTFEEALARARSAHPKRAADRQEECRRVLTELGVPRSRDGYWYLAEALDVILQSGEPCVRMYKEVYPGVIARLGGNEKQLEKAMRDAVAAGWRDCGPEMRQKYFGGREKRPALKEFLACAADAVRRRV